MKMYKITHAMKKRNINRLRQCADKLDLVFETVTHITTTEELSNNDWEWLRCLQNELCYRVAGLRRWAKQEEEKLTKTTTKS